MGVIKIVGEDGERHEVVVPCLLEALEGRVILHSLWKAIPQTGERSIKSVEVYSQVGFWKCNQDGITRRMYIS